MSESEIQHQNRATAYKMLEFRLYELELESKMKNEKIQTKRYRMGTSD